MIERLQRIATLLAKFRVVILLSAGLFLALIALSVVDNPWLAGDDYLMPSILGFCWALMLFSTSEIFRGAAGRVPADAPLLKRLSQRLRRFAYWLLAVLTVVSAVALVIFSYQLLRVWL